MTATEQNAIFDYRALRLLMGVIAFSLPFATSIVSSQPLASISASYYTEGHDIFIGMLCIISTLLWAYNGHSVPEKVASKIASIATLLVVIFPTNCYGCGVDIKSIIHYGAAATVFGILIYFCLGPFRDGKKGVKGKKGLRANIYLICGSVMIICMLIAAITQFMKPADQVQASTITYWTETFALISFGVAWIVAGKVIPWLTEKDERLKLSLK
jgi:hypothetical protein